MKTSCSMNDAELSGLNIQNWKSVYSIHRRRSPIARVLSIHQDCQEIQWKMFNFKGLQKPKNAFDLSFPGFYHAQDASHT